ncbi:MAG TPA: acyl-CoA dehydrogenase family protein [Mycobacteriales bacterium]|nr:acyl-CoA dehydrogenase family protein [Mycobacteriales bacterium]
MSDVTVLVARIVADHPDGAAAHLRAAGVADAVTTEEAVDVAVALGRWSASGALELLALDARTVPADPLVAAVLVGAGEACVRLGVAYARQREAFGRPLSKQPVQRQAFADVSTALAAAIALVRRARTPHGTALEAMSCVPVAADAAWAAAEAALQVHGGYGYSDDYEVSGRWQELLELTSAVDRAAYDAAMAG